MAALLPGTTVAITGVSGFLASELCAQLLARGVKVHGTVRSLADPTRTEHLLRLPGAAESLHLFEADLITNVAGFAKAFVGCSVIFHAACPFHLAGTAEPLGEEYFVEPAVKGTVAILETARAGKIAIRVVLTSSTAAIFKRLVEVRGADSAAQSSLIYRAALVQPDYVYDEACWNDPEELATRKLWYSIAKTKQERAAWAWMEEHKPAFSLVSINPTMIAGAARQPSLNASLEAVRDLFSPAPVKNINMPWVHVKDVAEGHIAAAEKPSASGRYMMVAKFSPLSESAAVVKACGVRGLPVATEIAAGLVPAPVNPFDSSRVERELLGRPLRGLEEIMWDSVASLLEWGHIKEQPAAAS